MAASKPADALAGMWESVDAVPPLQTGVLTKTRLANWELLRSLGEGEFAKVQSCRREGDTTIYACKHISKARLVCASNIKRTLRRVRRVGTEIQAMRSLRHKSICMLHDVIHTPEYVHVVMENGGRDLYEVIGDKSGVSMNVATTVAHALTCALAHCLDNGVVHRDVKPENVLVRASFSNSEEVEAVKLCDFGLCAIAPAVLSVEERMISREADGSSPLSRKVSPTTIVESSAACGVIERQWTLSDFSGSPGFVAPEIVTAESYDGRFVDAWSLGCVVLELTVGHGAFDHVWMNAYAHDTMADRRQFARELVKAIELLCQLPEFKPSRADAISSATVDGAPARRCSPAGDFILGFLEIDPLKRTGVHDGRLHPWLAEVEARERALEAAAREAAEKSS